MNLYNEIDPQKALWLKELMKAGLISEGIVDERSIEEIKGCELESYEQCHFFAGIGIWSYALRLAGYHGPCWTASCPCQPFSVAGQGKGEADERHLWPAWFRLISERRPVLCFGEQVSDGDGQAWLDTVQIQMESIGYRFGSLALPAASVGAPHGRHRTFFVADTEERRTLAKEQPGQRTISQRGSRVGFMAESIESERRRRTSDGRGQQRNGSQAGREQNASDSEWRGTTVGMADAIGNGAQRTGREKHITFSGTSIRGATDILGNSSNGGQQREHGRISDEFTSQRRGPCNGFWSDSEWIPCRVPEIPGAVKWRPAQSKLIALPHGTPPGVLPSSGRREPDIQTAEEKERINEHSDQTDTDKELRTMRSTDGKKALRKNTRRSGSVQTEALLQSEVHGIGDGKRNLPKYILQSRQGSSDDSESLRDMRVQKEVAACSSQRPEPSEQRCRKLADFVRLLPCSLALSELSRDTITQEALQTLRESLGEKWFVQHASHSPEEIWRSLNNENKNRIAMVFDSCEWYRRAEFPLARRSEARILRLKGYGDGIVAQVAAEFIKAYLEITHDR